MTQYKIDNCAHENPIAYGGLCASWVLSGRAHRSYAVQQALGWDLGRHSADFDRARPLECSREMEAAKLCATVQDDLSYIAWQMFLAVARWADEEPEQPRKRPSARRGRAAA